MLLIGVFPHADRSVVIIIADTISRVPVSDTVLINFPFILQEMHPIKATNKLYTALPLQLNLTWIQKSECGPVSE